MSLWCDCSDCGGSGDAFICENGLLRAQIMAAKSERKSEAIIYGFLGCALITLVLMVAVMAVSASIEKPAMAPSPERAASEMTDIF